MAAVLLSPRAAAAITPSRMTTAAAAAAAAAASSPSNTITSNNINIMPPSSSSSKNARLSAAADLIRNLDAALSGMTVAATSAAEDAARARRNARAAGEVARRYGGGLSKSNNNNNNKGKKKNANGNNESSGGGGLLERKRERRAAARMAAEARQRREHPMMQPSPRMMMMGGLTPRSARGEAYFWNNTADVVKPDGFETAAMVVESMASRPSVVVGVAAGSAGRNDDAGASHRPVDMDEKGPEEGSGAVTAEQLDQQWGHQQQEQQHQQQQQSMIDDLTEQPTATVEQRQDQPMGQMGEEQGQDEEVEEDDQPSDDYYAPQNPYYQPQQQQQQQHYQSEEGQKQNNGEEYHNHSTGENDQSHHSQPQPSSQLNSATRIEASHAEDVLSLSLELQRVRSQLATAVGQLENADSQLSSSQARNDRLQSQNEQLHSQLETHNERASTKLSSLQQRYEAEAGRAKAAEEDAALALELAKEAQGHKEECEVWLSRSLEEIDVWKGRCLGFERQLKEIKGNEVHMTEETAKAEEEEGVKKSVRWQDDCPPSPVVSEDGFECDENGSAAGAPAKEAPSTMPSIPQPSVWHSPQNAKDAATNRDGGVENNGINANNDAACNAVNSNVNTGIFSPTNNANNMNGNGMGESPSKLAIASGRAFLHRNASPSPQNKMTPAGLSPHPRQQASELLRKSAETRRLLRERLLAPGSSHGVGGGLRPPMGAKPNSSSSPKIPRVASDQSLNDGSFASRQGAACKAVGRMIRESSGRLNINGTLLLTNGSSIISNNISNKAAKDTSSPAAAAAEGEPKIEGVAQLESMVRDYCGNVEGTIGKQKEKIDELLAFCDHLEKEVMLGPAAGKMIE